MRNTVHEPRCFVKLEAAISVAGGYAIENVIFSNSCKECQQGLN